MKEEKIVKWLKKKAKEAKAKGFVVGLSGGIDSSVVSVLCKKALPKNTLCILMPCESIGEDLKCARRIVKYFKIKSIEINLTDVFKVMIGKYPRSKNPVAIGNIKARLRMITLYYFANLNNYLVVGTGNKSELMMGYFTKYGDGGVDILPLGNLVKSDVIELAEELNIPCEIIKRPPSAGLWKGQTDEKEMGITYNSLDGILKNKIKGINKNLIAKVRNKIKFTAHKRKMPEIMK